MTWPTYAKFVLSGSSEGFDPSVERTEMERGPAKQRILNSDVTVQITGIVLFVSQTDIASFETWYFDTIGRIGYFDFTHPRTGSTVQARFVGGRLGELIPQTGGYAIATREVTIEYQR